VYACGDPLDNQEDGRGMELARSGPEEIWVDQAKCGVPPLRIFALRSA